MPPKLELALLARAAASERMDNQKAPCEAADPLNGAFDGETTAAAKASWNYVLDAIETIHPGPTEAGSGTIDTPNDIA